MERLVRLRSIRRSAFTRCCRIVPASAAVFDPHLCHGLPCHSASGRLLHQFSHSPLVPSPKHPLRDIADCRASFASRIGSCRSFREGVSHYPDIKDTQILYAFKDLLACDWKDLPAAVIHDVKKALSKNTDDKAGQEALANVFRAAEAVEEFGGTLVTLRMKIDDCIGLTGEDVKPLPVEFLNALRSIISRYNTYLGAFGPEETYLRKKVEVELGTKLIHLKMRFSPCLGSDWGKATVLGTSGLSGSYIEQRAR